MIKEKRLRFCFPKTVKIAVLICSDESVSFRKKEICFRSLARLQSADLSAQLRLDIDRRDVMLFCHWVSYGTDCYVHVVSVNGNDRDMFFLCGVRGVCF